MTIKGKMLLKVNLYFIIILLLIFLILVLIQPKKENARLVWCGVYQTIDSFMYQKYDNGIISTYGDVSDTDYDRLCDAYERLPETIRRSFAEDGWKIIVSAYPIDTLVEASHTMIAVMVQGDHTIYVYKDYAYGGVLLHEIGHYFDEKNGYISSGIEDIRGRERLFLMELEPKLTNTDVASAHNTENASEYFATAFALYVLSPCELYTSCPDTYAYIKDVIDSFTKS